MNRRLRIGFVSTWDPADVKAWSGTPYFMRQALMARGHEVVPVGPLRLPYARGHALFRRLCRTVGRHYDAERSPAVARAYARQAAAVLPERLDLILSTSSIPVAHLHSDTPVVFWTDTVFGSMINFYPGKWSNLLPMSRTHGQALDTQALQRADISIFASNWAADAAVSLHGADRDKLAVIPLGANLIELPDAETVARAIAERPQNECRLLFIGVEWLRKGGDLVVATAAELQARGLNVRVDVVGCEPDGPQPAFVHRHGFISKATEEGRAALGKLLLQAHYLFVPSLAECYGLVYAEASAHGVPALARRTGGVPTVIRDGVNGHVLAPEAPAADYADIVQAGFSDPQHYAALATASRREFETRLNWDAAMQSFEARVLPLLEGRRGACE